MPPNRLPSLARVATAKNIRALGKGWQATPDRQLMIAEPATAVKFRRVACWASRDAALAGVTRVLASRALPVRHV